MAKANNIFIWYAVAAVIAYYFFFSDNVNAAALSTGNGTGSGMVSDNQLQQTESFEGFSPSAYPDGSNNGVQSYSIGYGHQIGPNESYLLTGSITQAAAQQLLLNDMQNVVNTINNNGITLTSGQFDALSDFGYNAGVSPLNNVLSVFNSSGADAAQAQMLKYVYWHPVPGGPAVLNQSLVTRRNSEIATFNS